MELAEDRPGRASGEKLKHCFRARIQIPVCTCSLYWFLSVNQLLAFLLHVCEARVCHLQVHLETKHSLKIVTHNFNKDMSSGGLTAQGAQMFHLKVFPLDRFYPQVTPPGSSHGVPPCPSPCTFGSSWILYHVPFILLANTRALLIFKPGNILTLSSPSS